MATDTVDKQYYHFNESPVVVGWTDAARNSCRYFGRNRPGPVLTLALGYDTDQKTATIRIAVPCNFKPLRQVKYLYLFVDPSHVQAMIQRPCEPDELTTPFVSTRSRSSDEMVAIDLQLSASPTVVGPASLNTLVAKGNARGMTLASLHALSQTLQMTLIAPKQDSANLDKLSLLCAHMSSNTYQPKSQHYSWNLLYKGQGGKDIGNLLAPFNLPTTHTAAEENDEDLPSYDQAAAGASTAAGKRKRPSSSVPFFASTPLTIPGRASSDVPASPPKAWVNPSSSPPPEAEMLRREIDLLRRELLAHPNYGKPSDDAAIVARFDSFEQRLDSFDRRLSHLQNTWKDDDVQERLCKRIASRLFNPMKTHVDQEISALLEDNLSEMIESTVDYCFESAEDSLVAFKEDIEFSINDRIKLAIEDHVTDMVNSQLDEVVADQLEHATFDLESASIKLNHPV